MRVTTRMLKEIGACEWQTLKFKSVFSPSKKGVLVTKKSLQRAIDESFHLGILVSLLANSCLGFARGELFTDKNYDKLFGMGRNPEDFMLCFVDLRKETKKNDSRISKKLKKELFSR